MYDFGIAQTLFLTMASLTEPWNPFVFSNQTTIALYEKMYWHRFPDFEFLKQTYGLRMIENEEILRESYKELTKIFSDKRSFKKQISNSSSCFTALKFFYKFACEHRVLTEMAEFQPKVPAYLGKTQGSERYVGGSTTRLDVGGAKDVELFLKGVRDDKKVSCPKIEGKYLCSVFFIFVCVFVE